LGKGLGAWADNGVELNPPSKNKAVAITARNQFGMFPPRELFLKLIFAKLNPFDLLDPLTIFVNGFSGLS
jgi:hypothetical protein